MPTQEQIDIYSLGSMLSSQDWLSPDDIREACPSLTVWTDDRAVYVYDRPARATFTAPYVPDEYIENDWRLLA